jgi:membrane associated rhomboid family serine protease
MNQFRTGGFSMLPPVVKNLLIINILLFLATETLIRVTGIDLRDHLGLHWFGSEKFEFYQPITYMFMHGNFEHILFNMFAVWMFGNAIENFWGSKRFLIYYLITGLGAAGLHYGIVYFDNIQQLTEITSAFLQNPDSGNLEVFLAEYQINATQFPALNNILNGTATPVDIENAYNLIERFKIDYLNLPVVIGASGSLFGILLAFGMMFPNAELFLIFIPIPIKAKYFVAGYGIIELYSGITGSSDGIAHFAHLGGLITGFILIKFWQKFDSSFRLL